MIKAIFFDIDGTLVSFKTHTIPASTVEAVNRAKAKGVKVFISTGRPLVHIDNLGELSFDGYITLNGGYCLTADKQVIYKQGMDSRDMEALVRYQTAGKEPFPCVFVSEHDLFMNYLNDDLAGVIKMINIKTPPQKDIREILNMDILQVMAYFR